MDATHAQPYAARLTRPDGADGTVWLLAKHDDSERGAEEAAALVRSVKPSKARTHRRASPRRPRQCRGGGFAGRLRAPTRVDVASLALRQRSLRMRN